MTDYRLASSAPRAKLHELPDGVDRPATGSVLSRIHEPGNQHGAEP